MIDVVDIAKDLMILVRNNPRLIKMFASKDNQLGQQLMARAKQLEAENPTYGYYKDTIGSLLSGLGRSTSKSTTEKETSASDSVTVDLSPFDGYARALRQFESRTDQSGKQPELDGGATKDEVAKLRIKIKYGRLLKLVASNVIHLAIWFDFCDCVSMDLLFGGADSLLRKPAKITKDSLLVKARTLWDLIVVDTPFDPLRNTLLRYIERALIPGLESHEREALEVAEFIRKYSTDTRIGTKKGVEHDRPTLMKQGWTRFESQSLSGQAPTGDATCSQKGTTSIRQVASLAMGALARDSIMSRVPSGVFPRGNLIRELVVLSSEGILRDYDFFCKEWKFFGKSSHSLDTDFIKTMNQNLKDAEEDLKTDIHIVIDDRIQIESLRRLVNGANDDDVRGV